jgi:hypothetical protein
VGNAKDHYHDACVTLLRLAVLARMSAAGPSRN